MSLQQPLVRHLDRYLLRVAMSTRRGNYWRFAQQNALKGPGYRLV